MCIGLKTIKAQVYSTGCKVRIKNMLWPFRQLAQELNVYELWGTNCAATIGFCLGGVCLFWGLFCFAYFTFFLIVVYVLKNIKWYREHKYQRFQPHSYYFTSSKHILLWDHVLLKTRDSPCSLGLSSQVNNLVLIGLKKCSLSIVWFHFHLI